MKVSTLACDYCTAVVAAVGTVKLLVSGQRVNKKGLPELDLCKRHLGAVVRAFKPQRRWPSGKMKGRVAAELPGGLAAVEAKRTADRERHAEKQKHAGGHPKGDVAPWAEREATVLGLMPARGAVSTVELWRQVTQLQKPLRPGAYKKVMQRLKARGMVKQIGSRSRTKYERANGRA